MHLADCDPLTIELYFSRKGGPDPSKHRCPECKVALPECSCGFAKELEAMG